MFNVYTNQLSRQTGNRNRTDQKTLPIIWYTYMTLVHTSKYTPAARRGREIYCFTSVRLSVRPSVRPSVVQDICRVNKNKQNQQTGSRNILDPKTRPMLWGTYMKLVTKYQISAINCC
jgi:hypothetical protein